MSPTSPERKRTPDRLTHVGPDGQARMVDVGAKPVTAREAVARGRDPRCRRRRGGWCGPGRSKKGDAAADGAARRHHGRQADGGADPALSSAAAVRHRRRRSSPARDGYAHREPGADRGPDRRRDGSADRGQRGRAHPLRHGQGGRQGDDDHRHRAGREARRPIRRLPPPSAGSPAPAARRKAGADGDARRSAGSHRRPRSRGRR